MLLDEATLWQNSAEGGAGQPLLTLHSAREGASPSLGPPTRLLGPSERSIVYYYVFVSSPGRPSELREPLVEGFGLNRRWGPY